MSRGDYFRKQFIPDKKPYKKKYDLIRYGKNKHKTDKQIVLEELKRRSKRINFMGDLDLLLIKEEDALALLLRMK